MNDTFNRAHANTFKGTGLCGADKDTTEVYFAKHIAIFEIKVWIYATAQSDSSCAQETGG